MAERPVRRREP